MTAKKPNSLFCNIWRQGKAWWLPRPFSARYRRGSEYFRLLKTDVEKYCTLVRFLLSKPVFLDGNSAQFLLLTEV